MNKLNLLLIGVGITLSLMLGSLLWVGVGIRSTDRDLLTTKSAVVEGKLDQLNERLKSLEAVEELTYELKSWNENARYLIREMRRLNDSVDYHSKPLLEDSERLIKAIESIEKAAERLQKSPLFRSVEDE